MDIKIRLGSILRHSDDNNDGCTATFLARSGMIFTPRGVLFLVTANVAENVRNILACIVIYDDTICTIRITCMNGAPE